MSPDRLRASDLHAPFHGTRDAAHPVTVEELARSLQPLLADGQYLSHLTAAELHAMRLPHPRPAPRLHVSYAFAHRAMRRPEVVGHKTILPPSLEVVRGFPVSAPVDAWCESATLLSVRDLVVMGDGLIRRREPVATIQELTQAVAARAGRRGAARLRAALPLLRAGTDSARETELRLLIAHLGFPEPLVNAGLADKRGRVIAHGDLVWPGHRVVLEYDGRQHAEDRAQYAIDIRRLNAIGEAEYRVIRVDAVLFHDETRLSRLLCSALGPPLNPPDPVRGRVSGL